MVMNLLADHSEDERCAVIDYLRHQINLVIVPCEQLSSPDLLYRPSPIGSLTLAGILKHITFVLKIWTDRIISAPNSSFRDTQEKSLRDEQHKNSFIVDANNSDDSYEMLLTNLANQWESTYVTLMNVSFDQQLPATPNFARFYPEGNWTIRWVALHLIEEIARHGGHADFIRESIDGATLSQLLGRENITPTFGKNTCADTI